jgi:subtilisin family serine protease
MKKLIGIFIMMLLILTTIPTIGMINEYQSIRHDDLIENEYVPGEFIIKFTETPKSILSVENLKEKFNVYSTEKIFKNSEDTILDNIYRYKVPLDSDILSIVEEFNTLDNVVYSEPNYIIDLFSTPNDEFFPIQWSLLNTGQMIYNKSGLNDADIDMDEAWDIETGSEEIIIAIIDTGVDYTHPDLVDNIWINEDEIPGNEIDDDNNGFIDDIYGFDTGDNDSDPSDFRGHGTHCAGIASGVGNNEIGIAGVAWDCRIMIINSFNDTLFYGGILELAMGISYAADNAADVISMSLGYNRDIPTIKDAIDYAYSQGCVLVAAAGNSNESEKIYPAGYENVIAVAATNQNDQRCSPDDWGYYGPPFNRKPLGSHYGYWIDVAAPGNLVYSTTPTYHVSHNDEENFNTGQNYTMNYDFMYGTSMATPHVAGLAVLLLSQDPTLSNDEIREIIRANVDIIEPDEYIGTGRINAYKALSRYNTQPDIPVTPSGRTNGRPGREYTFTTSATDEDGDGLYYFWDWGDGNYSEWIGPFDSGEECEASYTWQQEANFSIKVKTKDGKGGESYWSEEFIFSTPKNKGITSTDVFWSDNFDSYNNGQKLDGGPDDGGWKLYDDGVNNPPPGGGEVVDYVFRSPPHSLEVYFLTDIVHEFTGLNSGNLTCTMWTYVPNMSDYGSALGFFSYYRSGFPDDNRAQIALQVDNIEKLFWDMWDEKFLENIPIINEQWIEFRLELNLDDGWCECYYNNELLLEGVWTSLGYGDGYRNFAGIDLWWGSQPVYFDDLSIEWESNGLETDLDGEGSLNWVDVETESVVIDSFTLENVGDPGSWLEWRVYEYPDFGQQWYCDPNEGLLKPEDGPITVEVRVKAPEDKNRRFTGDLKIHVIGDPDDEVIIPVTLTTPKSRSINNFNIWINRLVERFSILESFLRI